MKPQACALFSKRSAKSFAIDLALATTLSMLFLFSLRARAEIVDYDDPSREPASVSENQKNNDETNTVDLGKRFAIYIDSHIVAEFQNSDQGWKNRDAKAFTNWKFFENFTDSLDSYRVDFKLAEDEIKPEAPSFELRTGGRVYKFKKVGDHTWAVRRPGQKEYEASRSFSFFGDMDASTWSSPFEKSLRIVKDPTAAITVRVTALRSIIDSPSNDVKAVLKSVLLTEGENEEIRQEIVNALRRQPTNQNIKTLMTVLQTSKSELLRNQISKALRVRNPKGPVIEVDDEDQDVKKKLAIWRTWSHELAREEASSHQ